MQNYFIGYAQDEWHVEPNVTLNYGLRYDYYTPLTRGEQPDRQVQHRHRRHRSEHDAAATRRRRTTSSRACRSPTRRGKTVFRAGFGIFVGPGPDRRPDSAGRERPHQLDAQQRGAYPVDPAALRRELHQQPEQPVVPAARLRERLHDPRAHLPVHRVGAAGAARPHGGDGRLRRQPGAQPVPAQRRQPDHAGRHQPEPGERGDRHPRVLDRAARRRRQHHRRAEPVRRSRLQDQRRPRQLQRDAAVADTPVGAAACR